MLPGAPGSTETMVGLSLSLSKMEPVAATPSTVNWTVSVTSTSVSSLVGKVAVKLVIPAATVIVPSSLLVTPALKSRLE